jgi:hypothetical protein
MKSKANLLCETGRETRSRVEKQFYKKRNGKGEVDHVKAKWKVIPNTGKLYVVCVKAEKNRTNSTQHE